MTKNNWNTAETEKALNLRRNGLSWPEIGKALGRSDTAVRVHLKRYNAEVDFGIPEASPEFKSDAPTLIPVTHEPIVLPRPTFGYLPLSVVDSGDWARFGLVADTHLGSKEERLAELHCQYDLFQKEGITTVFHAGNPIDGYVARINGESVYETTIDGQANYFAENYPCRDGITTYYITGDDHESWFAPGFNIGFYMQRIAEAAPHNRKDLIYIGHVEADVAIQVGKASRPTIVKVMHPGGGSAYARSYKGQKQVEAFEGGEKPDILVCGHYHVSNYMNDRNIHVLNLPGFQDQTIFARKKNLRMEVGGVIMEFKVAADGTVTRFRPEFNRYFTRGYYKRFIKSDTRVLKGKLSFNV
jgi:predicted phosphodiesterase